MGSHLREQLPEHIAIALAACHGQHQEVPVLKHRAAPPHIAVQHLRKPPPQSRIHAMQFFPSNQRNICVLKPMSAST